MDLWKNYLAKQQVFSKKKNQSFWKPNLENISSFKYKYYTGSNDIFFEFQKIKWYLLCVNKRYTCQCQR